jgi:hypothetical protein
MRDVIDLYNRVGEGAEVRVIRDSLLQTPQGREYARQPPVDAAIRGLTSAY